MFSSIFTRSLLAASLCLIASVQAAHAAAPMSASTRALQAMDINDSRTPAGRAYKAEAKRTGADCPFANKSGRDDVLNVAENSLVGSTSRNGAVRQ